MALCAGGDRDGAAGGDVRAADGHAPAAGARRGRHRGPAAHSAGVPLSPREETGYNTLPELFFISHHCRSCYGE